MSPTCIRALDVSALDIPLFTPFGISGGAQAMANNALVRLELENGCVGFGEAAPLPPYNGETQADALRVLRQLQAPLIGKEVADWRRLAEEIRGMGGGTCGAAQSALEQAIVDALAQSQGRPLWKFFGGAGTELETDMTVTTGTAQQAADDARAIRARGIRTIKVKVGGAKGAAHDLERLQAIHDAAPDAPLILDGNAGVSRSHASELAAGLRAAAIRPALLEQWLAKDDLTGARSLREETGWLVAADESACCSEDVTKLADAQAADVVNIKLMKAGISSALDIVRVAKARGIGLMIGGNVESILAMTVSACFACGQGGFAFADLDTPWFLAENPFRGGFAVAGGTISVAALPPGHGVKPEKN